MMPRWGDGSGKPGSETGPGLWHRKARPVRIPTIPGLPAALVGPSSRSALLAALSFVEAPRESWGHAELTAWIDEHLVARGLMKMPRTLREPGAPPVSLDPRIEAPEKDVQELVARARDRVLGGLRGLVAPVVDDRFLNAAIFSGRVRRGLVGGQPAWIASPRETDFLGETVQSLFAADVLMDRDFYRVHLCVCDVCGSISFRRDMIQRRECDVHRSGRSRSGPPRITGG